MVPMLSVHTASRFDVATDKKTHSDIAYHMVRHCPSLHEVGSENIAVPAYCFDSGSSARESLPHLTERGHNVDSDGTAYSMFDEGAPVRLQFLSI